MTKTAQLIILCGFFTILDIVLLAASMRLNYLGSTSFFQLVCNLLVPVGLIFSFFLTLAAFSALSYWIDNE